LFTFPASTNIFSQILNSARNGSRRLASLSPSERANIISNISESLLKRENDILAANRLDLEAATRDGITGPMYSRLALTKGKLETLAIGLRQIAETSHNNVGRVIRRTKVSESMDLIQKTVPIGVLMVIFESRPDALPQVASLAIASANGLLLKGGKEAHETNTLLMNIVNEALGNYGCADAISMVSGREAVGDLLKLDEYIDLVIPRGSGELVKHIKEQSKMIPVLGHSEGVCHVYLDVYADHEKALKIVKDAKTDYPSACNAMETLLFHEDLVDTPMFHQICQMLKNEGVTVYAGPKIMPKMTFAPEQAQKLKHEYGGMACTIEMVRDVDEAINHIHKYGSGHTDVIVTDDKINETTFLEGVDSACVFANCSTRMADGYRLGLGK
jgi:delta-1-pyrroline-5-carboxylate synthetase